MKLPINPRGIAHDGVTTYERQIAKTIIYKLEVHGIFIYNKKTQKNLSQVYRHRISEAGDRGSGS